MKFLNTKIKTQLHFIVISAFLCSFGAFGPDLSTQAYAQIPDAQSPLNYFGLYLGGQFEAKGKDMSAQEDLNYTAPVSDLHAATASDVDLESSFTAGFKSGRFFGVLPGFGIEIEGQYSRPDFKRQNVDITLNDITFAGHSTFTEDQLKAEFHMFMAGINFLYRFEPLGWFRPYIGGGPAFFALLIRGTGDSGHIVAPSVLANNGFIDGGEMTTKGTGFGFNAKAGVEIPLNDRWSLDAEYKYTFGKMDVDNFRSFSDIEVDFEAHNVTAGIRMKF